MKWSPILHSITFISGVIGFLVLVAYWIVSFKQGVDPFSTQHLYDDAIAILLISIAFGVGTIIHLLEEKK